MMFHQEVEECIELFSCEGTEIGSDLVWGEIPDFLCCSEQSTMKLHPCFFLLCFKLYCENIITGLSIMYFKLPCVGTNNSHYLTKRYCVKKE